MLASISLKNFQIHRSRKITFDPKITTIRGFTNQGKSTFIRALYWICFNRPSWEVLRSHGADWMGARLRLRDNDRSILIERKRSKSENLYRLNGEKLSALGRAGVPDEISNILNVSPDCFQLQLDPIFWFCLSPAQVAKEINRIVNLDLIDHSLGKLNSGLREAKNKVRFNEERLQTTKEELESLDWVEKSSSQLRKIEKTEKRILEVQKRRDRLMNLLSTIQDASTSSEKLSKRLQEAKRLERRIKRIKTVATKCRAIKRVMDQIEERKSSCQHLQKSVRQIENRIDKALRKRCPLCGRENAQPRS